MRKRTVVPLALLLVCASVVGIARVTAQQPPPGPAPEEDRVGFPENYRDWGEYYVFDRPDNKQVRVIYANDHAAGWQDGSPFAYGSILVMETYRAVVDAGGNPVLDDQGRYQRGDLTGIFVMRKEPGFGEAYEQNRTGEWEYVAFRPDRSYLTPPRNSASCAICHGDAGTARDWTFRTDLHTRRGSGAVPRGLIQSYQFLPAEIRARAGDTVTWYNNDAAAHTVSATDGGFDSGRMRQGNSFSHRFTTAGTFEFQCNLHPVMKGRVVIE